MILGTKQQIKKLSFNSISISGETIEAKPSVRNLGVWLDTELKMTAHVNQIVKTCNFHIHQLYVICHYLTKSATKTLVQAIVLSRMDYCNSPLVNISTGAKLDNVQFPVIRIHYNALLRITTHD